MSGLPSSWLWPGPAPADVVIWGSEPMDVVRSLWLSLCLSNKIFYKLKMKHPMSHLY